MKTLLLLILSITAVLGRPKFPSEVGENPEKNQHPVVGDWIPAQGHVVVEHPAPQVLQSPKEKLENPDQENQKENEAKAETKEKPRLIEVQGLKTEEFEAKEELKTEPKPAANAPVEEEGKMEPEGKPLEEPDLKVESEVKVEVKGEPLYELEEEEDKKETDFRGQLEVRVDAEVQMELEPEEVHVLNAAPYPGMEVEERHIDMEKKPMPIMELEPLDDGDVHGEEVSEPVLSEEEMAFREAFKEEDTPAEHLPEEEEEEEEDKVEGEENLQEEKEDHDSDEEEIVELEPELTEEQSPEGIPETTVVDEEPIDPEMHQAVLLSQNYLPEEEEEMRMYVRDGEAPEQFLEEPVMEEEGFPMMMADDTYKQGGSYCPGIVTDGKCYQFFSEQKTFEDAEFFCQEHFLGGHLASVTSQHIHQELMRLVQQNAGYTRTWVGGRRLDSYRFVWLDGSRWSYEDWLPGEPNHTSNVEYCVEILGNGKFNDFPCWNLQVFICSYPAQ